MLGVRLAGDRLYGKQLFTWLSLVMSAMVSFCSVLSPRDVLDEIWDSLCLFLRVFLPTLTLTRLNSKENLCISVNTVMERNT